jgi:hypothetical protein
LRRSDMMDRYHLYQGRAVAVGEWASLSGPIPLSNAYLLRTCCQETEKSRPFWWGQVAIFCALATICVTGLFVRRKLFGGELGGSKVSARISGAFFVSLWVVYIVLSILISGPFIPIWRDGRIHFSPPVVGRSPHL